MKVEVKIVSHKFSGPSTTLTFDVKTESGSDLDDDVCQGNDRELSDNDWQSKDLVSSEDNDEVQTDKGGYERFATFLAPKNMVETMNE